MDLKDYKANRFRRRFQPLLEREFQLTATRRSFERIQQSAWVGAAIAMFIMAFQRLVIPAGIPPLSTVLAVIGVAAALIIAMLMISARLPEFRRRSEWVVSPVGWCAVTLVYCMFTVALENERRIASYGMIMILLGLLYTIYRGNFGSTMACGFTITSTFLSYTWMHAFYTHERFLQVMMYLIAFNFLGIMACFVMERSERTVYLMNRELEYEKGKAEQLLFNMLPGPIAEKLKFGNELIAESHAAVTVMFADLVGFTRLSETMPPTRLVQVLGELFTEYDRIAERCGLEKIKTIGDSYMAAAGIPIACPDHADRCARGALELRAATDAFRQKTGFDVRVRIGVHSGPLVAGVIGTKKMIYDIWGTTVNIASRMESHGVADEIQISAATREELSAAHFHLSAPRLIELKGIGVMETFLLEPRLDGERLAKLKGLSEVIGGKSTKATGS